MSRITGKRRPDRKRAEDVLRHGIEGRSGYRHDRRAPTRRGQAEGRRREERPERRRRPARVRELRQRHRLAVLTPADRARPGGACDRRSITMRNER
ncbi:hypothetical protein E1288_11065 [Saccharopolyspora elongata]|uniref:Uncharacterized protein n=1 Tax=Saccharopolyspora elongata TaxID=2530387 RepID=A0A4R4Z965_9PSEU|nr:hypothetical protein E1288_11065 [Saccharopolyspora elongata]